MSPASPAWSASAARTIASDGPDGTLWVMDNAGGRAAVLDPRTGHLIASISVGIARACAAAVRHLSDAAGDNPTAGDETHEAADRGTIR